MNRLISILLIGLLTNISLGQTVLDPGDIAFIAINSDGDTDDFSFVLLEEIENGTDIHFTDNGWTSGGGFNMIYPESHFTWTATEDITEGSVIRIETNNGNSLPVSSMGIIDGERMTISIAGDQILAYQGTKENPAFIAAISFNQNNLIQPGILFDGDSYSNSTTSMPAELSIGFSAIHIYHPDNFTEQDNSRYNCTVTEGTRNELLNAINNLDNWLIDNTTPFDIDPFPCEFTISISTAVQPTTEKEFVVFPSPAKSHLNIFFKSEHDAYLLLYNNVGILINQTLLVSETTKHTINISHLPKGLYFVRVLSKQFDKVHKVVFKK